MLLRRHRENVVPQADEPQKEAVKVVEATEVAEPTPQPQTVDAKPKRRTTKKG